VVAYDAFCPQFVLPENIAHAFLTILFLVSGQWMAFFLNAPLLAFNVNKYDDPMAFLFPTSWSDVPAFSRIRNKNHMYDATEIFRTLSGHKKESFIKLGFYLLSFFYYLYRYVIT
jgi:protein cornichon